MSAEAINEAKEIFAKEFQYEERLPITEWVPGRLRLSERVSPDHPGPVDLNLIPYQWVILKAWECLRYIEFWLIMAAQSTKSSIAQFIFGYIIDQDPGSVMYGFPDQPMAKRRSRKHLRPFIEDCPVLARHMTGRADDMSLLEYFLDRMSVNFAWAGSASSLAGEPCPVVIGEEIDKWNHLDKEEAHPAELLQERHASAGDRGRGLYPTTPNLEGSPSDRASRYGTNHRIFVPCPECGDTRFHDRHGWIVTDHSAEDLAEEIAAAHYFVMEWEGFTGWGEERDPDRCAELAYYECPFCGHHIKDRQKHDMLMKCVGIPDRPFSSTFWIRIPRWYSPLVPWGKCVRDFYKAQGDPEALRNWTNSTAALVWKEQGARKTEKDIIAHCVEYPMGVLPFDPIALVMTVDVQQDEFYLVIRAWGEFERSALVWAAMLPRIGRPKETENEDGSAVEDPSFKVLDTLRERTWKTIDGNEFGLTVCGIDSPYDQAAVFDYCRSRPNCFPMQGEDGQKVPLQYSRPETVLKGSGKKEAAADSVYLVTWSTRYFRDLWLSKMAVGLKDPGAWWLPNEKSLKQIDADYIKQLTAFEKIRKVNKKNGKIEIFYKDKPNNHFWDGEIMQIVLMRVLGVRDAGETQTEEKIAEGSAIQRDNWVTMGR